MMMQQALLYFFGGLSLLAAIGVLAIRNVFQASMLLLACLLSLAGLYVLLYAEFLAVSQILIYAGGVLVLIIFAIMLSPPRAGQAPVVQTSRWPQGVLIGVTMFSLLSYAFGTSAPISSFTLAGHPVKKVGMLLMTEWVAPFEVAGLLLLVSLIGAAVIAAYAKQNKIHGRE